MGNHRFRLSDIMPNTWFYKLKDMSHRSRKSDGGQPSRAGAVSPKPLAPPASKLLPNRASCYYSSRTEVERFSFTTHSKAMDTQFPGEPHRHSKKRSRNKPLRAPPIKPRLVTSSVSAGYRARALNTEELLTPTPSPSETPTVPRETVPVRRDLYVTGEELELDFGSDDVESWLHSASCRFTPSTTDMDSSKNSKLDEFELELESISELKLPRILTKPAPKEAECEDKSLHHNSWIDQNAILVSKSKIANQRQSQPKVSPASLRRLRMRANSPRLASRMLSNRRPATTMQQKKGLSFPASFAVVKSSSDPQKDFRDSMMEMIVENNIRSSKDLEELLACYLSLNSNEYHEIIVQVFQQIWFDRTNFKL